MEEERYWRLERNEANGDGKPYKAPNDQESSPEISADFGESPSSPAGPEIKFNGVPVAKPAPAPMPQPVPVAPMQVETKVSASVTEITVDTTIDPGWNLSDLLCILHDCACQCQRTLACIVNSPEAAIRGHQVRMLRDCADLCHITWCFLQRNSRYSLKLLKLCARVCEACADGCASHMDIDSQRCAATCLRCAAACHSFIEANS